MISFAKGPHISLFVQLLSNRSSTKITLPLFAANISSYDMKKKYGFSQSRIDRWKNVEELFFVENTSTLKNKHILLIDDIGAELDINSRTLLSSAIDKLNCQVIITAIEQNVLDPFISLGSRDMKMVSEQIGPYVPGPYYSLGTDGFGRSETRQALRHFFEVDRYYIVLTAIRALALDGKLEMSKVDAVMKKYNLDPEKPSPITV